MPWIVILIIVLILSVLGISFIEMGIDMLNTYHYRGKVLLPKDEASDLVYKYGLDNFTSFQGEGTAELIYDFESEDKVEGLKYTKDQVSGLVVIAMGVACLVALIFMFVMS